MGNFPSKKNPKISKEAVDNFRTLFGDNVRLFLELDQVDPLDKVLDLEQMTISLTDAEQLADDPNDTIDHIKNVA